MKASRVGILCLALGFGGLMALSCASSTDQVNGYSAYRPAGSQQRAQARKEREARKQAMADLTAEPDAGKPPAAPPPAPPPPKPPPPKEPVDAGPAPSAAPSASASVSIADAGAPPTADKGALCDKLCERTVACARDMMSKGPPGMGGVMEKMVERMRTQCAEECAEKVATADSAKIAEGKACLAEPDCDKFMDCMRDLRGKD